MVENFRERLNEEQEQELKEKYHKAKKNSTSSTNLTNTKIRDILETKKITKAPGEHGGRIEILQVEGRSLENELFELVQEMWEKENMPASWKLTLIFSIKEKGKNNQR